MTLEAICSWYPASVCPQHLPAAWTISTMSIPVQTQSFAITPVCRQNIGKAKIRQNNNERKKGTELATTVQTGSNKAF